MEELLGWEWSQKAKGKWRRAPLINQKAPGDETRDRIEVPQD